MVTEKYELILISSVNSDIVVNKRQKINKCLFNKVCSRGLAAVKLGNIIRFAKYCCIVSTTKVKLTDAFDLYLVDFRSVMLVRMCQKPHILRTLCSRSLVVEKQEFLIEF